MPFSSHYGLEVHALGSPILHVMIRLRNIRNRRVIPMLTAASLTLALVCPVAGFDHQGGDSAQSIAAIKSLGGKMQVDENRPGKPVIGVDFGWNKDVSGRDLVYLKGLPEVRSLTLEATHIGEDGLMHLQELTALTSLNVAATGATDAFMKVVARMKELRSLNISQTQVTDKGLVQLRGLQKLESLDIGRLPSVHDAGLANLKGLQNLKQLVLIESETIRVRIRGGRLLSWC